MTEYRSLSSFLAFLLLSARVRFILPARAVAKQTVLCTHFDRFRSLTIPDALCTLHLTRRRQFLFLCLNMADSFENISSFFYV